LIQKNANLALPMNWGCAVLWCGRRMTKDADYRTKGPMTSSAMIILEIATAVKHRVAACGATVAPLARVGRAPHATYIEPGLGRSLNAYQPLSVPLEGEN